MKMCFKTVFALFCLSLLTGISLSADAQEIPADYQNVLTITGKKGDYKANVLKVNIPRSDLKISIDGISMPTSFGFGGWIAMTKGKGGNEVMMGDLVLQEDEVNPVMSALLDNGLEVTALHNHFFWEQPRIFYMHVHGFGKADELARKLKPALELIGTIKPHIAPATPMGDSPISAGKFDTAMLDKMIGKTGENLAGGVYKYTIGRDDLKIKEMGATINARMGLNTWAAFFGSDDNTVVAGDVAMLETEVTQVLKALRSHGLHIVAIHHHMTGSRPMLIFLHYWGQGPAEKLATGFKAALDQLGKSKNAGHMAMDR